MFDLSVKSDNSQKYTLGCHGWAPKCHNKMSQQCLPPDRLGNFRKLSTKNATKLENSSDLYGFFTIFIVTIWW